MFKCHVSRVSNEVQFPCLMKSTITGNIYIMNSKSTGMCLQTSQVSKFAVGEIINTPDIYENLVLHNEPMTLENIHG